MKRVHTAKQISCPECDNPVTKVTCGNSQLGRKYRYRRCGSCGHKFKTSQSLSETDAKETIVPYLDTVLLRRQERLRGGGSSKLNPSDVREIRKLWAKAVYKDKQEKIYIAEQFNVKERAVDNILTGKAWSFVS